MGLLFHSSFDRSPMTKVRAVMSGESGLLVWTSLSGSTEELLNGPNAEYRRGTDVSIRADVLRGHRGKKEAWIEWIEQNRTVQLSMLPTQPLAVWNLSFLLCRKRSVIVL